MMTTLTGTCPCCFGSFVVHGGTMVLHGYKRPGHGYIHGRCPATKTFKPFEVSVDGTVYMRKLALDYLNNLRDYLTRLQSGAITEMTVRVETDEYKNAELWARRDLKRQGKHLRPHVIRKGDGQKQYSYDHEEWFVKALRYEIGHVEDTIQSVEADVAMLSEKITTWKPADLTAKNEQAAAKVAAADAKLCSGSGKYMPRDNRHPRYVRCPDCGGLKARTSTGLVRKHEPKAK